jgi:hypothetical protein
MISLSGAGVCKVVPRKMSSLGEDVHRCILMYMVYISKLVTPMDTFGNQRIVYALMFDKCIRSNFETSNCV